MKGDAVTVLPAYVASALLAALAMGLNRILAVFLFAAPVAGIPSRMRRLTARGTGPF
jgi:hypothetical protein